MMEKKNIVINNSLEFEKLNDYLLKGDYSSITDFFLTIKNKSLLTNFLFYFFNFLVKKNETTNLVEYYLDWFLKLSIINLKHAAAIIFNLSEKASRNERVNFLKKGLDFTKKRLIDEGHIKNFELNFFIIDNYPPSLVKVEKIGNTLNIFHNLSGKKNFNSETRNTINLISVSVPILVCSQINNSMATIYFELSDYGEFENTATFSSANEKSVLIPDYRFVNRSAYKEILLELKKINKFTFSDAIWAGSINSIDRFIFVKNNINNKNLKLNITKVLKEYDFSYKINNRIPFLEQFKYLIQIDIDGIGNAYDSCFLKLASGFPVLKLQSSRNFRQWYYDDLKNLDNLYFFDNKNNNFQTVFNNCQKEWEKSFINKKKENFLTKMTLENELKLAAHRVMRISNKSPN